jgi:hypothetical protein
MHGGSRRSEVSAAKSQSNKSKSQTRVFVAAARAGAKRGAGRGRVEAVAADAVERRLAPLLLEAPMVPAVEKKPDAQEEQPNQGAIDDRGDVEIEHAGGKKIRVEAGFDA